MEEAERHLAEAFKRGHPGRFQLEAAIQSVHAERARTGRTDWAAIALFYEKLIRISPALGTRVGYAAAVAEASGPETGISVLDVIEPEGVSNYQPYWAVRAHPLRRLGKTREASDVYDRAIGLGRGSCREGVPHPKEGLIFFIEPVEINPPHPSPT
jgi:predicted RNA polymerase sigma factor